MPSYTANVSLLQFFFFFFSFSPLYLQSHFHSARHTKDWAAIKKKKKNEPLLQSLGRGSNTITMVQPGPQGTVLCPIRTPNEHTPHTKIM